MLMDLDILTKQYYWSVFGNLLVDHLVEGFRRRHLDLLEVLRQLLRVIVAVMLNNHRN
jgi:hypothetical protein